MKVSMVTGPGVTEVVDVPQPQAGAKDVLIRMRALVAVHTVPFENVGAALEMAATPGAADKVVVNFG